MDRADAHRAGVRWAADQRFRARNRALIDLAAMAHEAGRALVVAEWPHGLVKTVPTRKGAAKLLMQRAEGTR